MRLVWLLVPLLAVGDVVLYPSPKTQGDFGNGAAALCFKTAPASCVRPVPVMTNMSLYADEDGPVVSRSGELFAETWGALVDHPPPLEYWIRGCRDWTTNRVEVDGVTLAGTRQSCFVRAPILCACERAPVEQLTLYTVQAPGAMGDVGPRARADRLCATQDEYYGYRSCSNPAAVLCFDDGDDVAALARTHGYSPNATIFYEGAGVEFLGWADFLQSGIAYAPGCDAQGHAGRNCADFSQRRGLFVFPGGAHGRCTERDPPLLCLCPTRGVSTQRPASNPETTMPTAQPDSATPTLSLF